MLRVQTEGADNYATRDAEDHKVLRWRPVHNQGVGRPPGRSKWSRQENTGDVFLFFFLYGVDTVFLRFSYTAVVSRLTMTGDSTGSAESFPAAVVKRSMERWAFPRIYSAYYRVKLTVKSYKKKLIILVWEGWVLDFRLFCRVTTINSELYNIPIRVRIHVGIGLIIRGSSDKTKLIIAVIEKHSWFE